MKILVITQYFPLEGIPALIGGISFSLKSFFDAFNKKNHIVSIFLFYDNINNNKTFPSGIHNVSEYKKHIGKNFFSIIKKILFFFKEIIIQDYTLKLKMKLILDYHRRFLELINMINFSLIIKYYEDIHNYDLILAYDSKTPAQIGFLLGKKKKLITISHGNDILVKNNIAIYISLKSSQKIIVRSKFIRNLVVKLYDIKQSRIFICPDGLILEDFHIYKDKMALREELKLSEDKFYIISVGLLGLVRKSFDLVLKSIKEMRDTQNIDISKIEYILIGRDSPEIRERLLMLAKKYNIDKNFKLLVNLSNELRNKYYKASDIFVMPSKDLQKEGSVEGFGKAFIEAGYYGLPSIGSNTGGISDAIEDGKSGFLVNNFNELVDKIKILFENKDVREKMGKYAHERVINEFSWEKIYYKYLDSFKA